MIKQETFSNSIDLIKYLNENSITKADIIYLGKEYNGLWRVIYEYRERG